MPLCSWSSATLGVCRSTQKRLIAIAMAPKQECGLMTSPGTSRNPLENVPHVKMSPMPDATDVRISV